MRAKNPIYKQSANNLTREIIALITAKGGFATRVNSQGQWDPVRKVMRKGTTVKGMTDIVGVLKGRALFIEVKVGKDKLRPEQISVAQRVNRARGLWIMAKSLDEFYRLRVTGDAIDGFDFLAYVDAIR